MDEYLRVAVTNGTARRANIAFNARGKTGTTSNHWDVWFCGYTDQLLGLGWAANEVATSGRNSRWVYKPMPGAYGGGILAPLWGRIMQKSQIIAGEKDRMSLKQEIQKQSEGNFEDKQRTSGVDSKKTDPAIKDSKKDEPSQTKEDASLPDLSTQTDSSEQDSREKSPQKTEKVSLEVCSQSHLKANPTCPGVIIRSFHKGQEPKGVCKIH